jgi:2-polyprenyl-6-methoxyphenol hydroxylase-like FAD-dependent oxidoreductase
MMEKNNSDLEDALTIFWVIDSNDDVLDILNELLLQNWHTRHEEIIHSIQKISSPKSIRYIKEAMQINFQYLEDYGTGLRQFINQCGHALLSIGTKEAIELIYELSESKNQILKDEMLYRINKMNGKDDYKRNYNLI